MAAVPLTSSRKKLPCRERVSGPESVFVQSATQILLLCSIHPSRFRHCFDGWAAQRFDPTGQGDDKPLTPGHRQSAQSQRPSCRIRFWIPVSELEPMLGMPRSEWPADVLEELLIVPVRDVLPCSSSNSFPARNLPAASLALLPSRLLASQTAAMGLG